METNKLVLSKAFIVDYKKFLRDRGKKFTAIKNNIAAISTEMSHYCSRHQVKEVILRQLVEFGIYYHIHLEEIYNIIKAIKQIKETQNDNEKI